MVANTKSTMHPIATKVQKLYEAFPYPNYPLLARPQWQEGYLGSSQFAARLLEDNLGVEAAIESSLRQFAQGKRTILVGGAGEAQPYILRKLEPSKHRLLCIDLSQKSLRRARLRLLGNFKHTEFLRADIDDFILKQGPVLGPFHHIDLYGVLHHLASPEKTLRLLSHFIAPYGTMRVMVYNARARDWIYHLQHVLRLLKLNPYEQRDRDDARQLLRQIACESKPLACFFEAMGKGTFENDARFVDTFFHEREVRTSPADWLDLFERTGLKPYALFDRYLEMDDLANPLWQMPTAEAIAQRSNEHQFMDNLEIYLYRPGRTQEKRKHRIQIEKKNLWDVFGKLLRRPPSRWFDSKETACVPSKLRYELWWKHVLYTAGFSQGKVDDLRKTTPFTALQRLARLGAILPGQVADPNLRKIMMQPMSSSIEFSRESPPQWDTASSETADLAKDLLMQRQLFSEKRHKIILSRLGRAHAASDMIQLE